jgi:hypothetical protein
MIPDRPPAAAVPALPPTGPMHSRHAQCALPRRAALWQYPALAAYLPTGR